ncbi:MAG TPA: PBP1A family penicillin-binding protein [Nitrospirales bacterium]|nr:PBP1A family penicillin-binding protein [Nitrospirales bacterium]
MARTRRRRRKWKFLGAVLLVALGVPALYGLYLHLTLALPTGQDHESVRLYSAPFLLEPGADIEQVRLEARLLHLDYRRIAGKLSAPGEYRRDANGFEVYLREFLYPDHWRKADMVRITVEDGKIRRLVRLPDQTDLGPIPLEPQLLGGIVAASRQVRDWTPISTIPPRLIDAILAIEDRRFYDHHGVDPLAVLRALWLNLRASAVVQGGSTITQQLAKNLYYTPERTMLRKIEEAMAALVLEQKYTKSQILESYLNEIYFGQAGSVAVYGVGDAARRYFGKSVQELTLPECALLAAMIKGPNTYDPLRDPGRAKKRRDLVLARLHDDGKLNDVGLATALKTPVRTAQSAVAGADAPFFMDFVLSQFEEPLQARPRHGLRIMTTLDPEWQRLAEEALKVAIARLETRYPTLRRPSEPLQAALVALDPRTGAILAMVGGRDYRVGQFNHAVQARRQAGSLFKPFVYLAAFERGVLDPAEAISPLTRLTDEPITFTSGGTKWEPQNYDKKFRGEVTVRAALEQSLNVPAVRMAQTVGIGRVVHLLQNMGLQGPLDENLGLALGTSDVSLLEMTGAYAALANAGMFIAPTPLRAVLEQTGDKTSDVILAQAPEPMPVVSPQAAYLTTAILKGAVERGTAASARSLGLTGIVAGKTGTTDEHRDAWFIGYTPSLVVGVWVGFDDGMSLRLTGAQAALPVWVEFVKQVLPAAGTDFPIPAAVVSRAIDPESNLLASDNCPASREEVFLEGTEPTQYCDLHAPSWLERFKRLLQS